jgi:tripartite-type tricarboxylate transporter receptor subunit TctC
VASGVAWAQGAQAYPARPVRIVLGFAPGGAADASARVIGQWLSERLGQQFVVENRTGASGNIATDAVARAPADGYTLLLVVPAHAINVHLYDKLGHVFLRDIDLVAGIIRVPNVFEVNPEVPATSVREFIAYAKANPGKLNFTVAGTQNISHLAPVLLFARTGLQLVMVPTKSEPQAVSDLISGQVDLYFGNSSSLLPHIHSDTIRLIAVATAQRIGVAPDIPAVAETVPGFEFSSWNGFSAPAGTPEPILDSIQTELAAFAKSAEVSARLSKLGIIPGGLTREESAAVVKRDYGAFAAAVKAAGIELPK